MTFGGRCGTLWSMGSIERITIDPAVCHGNPTIRRQRYSVETIL